MGGNSSSQYSVLCGDLNIDLLDPTVTESEFINLMNSLSFLPLISLPTRVTDNSETCIDNFWTNSLVDVVSGVIPHKVTDHYAVYMLFPIAVENNIVKVSFRDNSSNNFLR